MIINAIWNAISLFNNHLFFLNDYENINKIILQNIVLRKIDEAFKMTIVIIFLNIVFIFFQKDYITHSRFKISLNIII